MANSQVAKSPPPAKEGGASPGCFISYNRRRKSAIGRAIARFDREVRSVITSGETASEIALPFSLYTYNSGKLQLIYMVSRDDEDIVEVLDVETDTYYTSIEDRPFFIGRVSSRKDVNHD